MSKVNKVASLLRMTKEDARAYCLEVQRLCKASPSFETIADSIEKLGRPNPKPRDVAEFIIRNNSNLKEIPNSLRKQSGSSKLYGGVSSPSEYQTFSPILAHDPREFTDQYEKCPHGVLKIKKCCICDPEGFRFETGID